MGFGGGSFVIGKLYQAWTPAEIGGWRTSFLVMGVLIFAVLAVCSFFFVAPPADFTAPPARAAAGPSGLRRRTAPPARC